MYKQFSSATRVDNLRRLKTERFDLAIVGGGINGAGVARDAASRGLKVALVEMQDYAEGTSSRSSKLIHGGIRYLENFEFDLVFEALSEREKLFHIAPTLVHPLRFVMPIFKSSRVGMFKMGLGMWFYDVLSLFRAPEMHERLSPSQTLSRLPMLQSQGLCGSYVYSDAYMDDDRLVIETLRSANQLGAVCVNHVKASGAIFDSKGEVRGLNCKEALTGESFKLSAKHIVSTVGPWTDELGHSFFEDWSDLMRPSKGVHLTFQKERVPLTQAIVMGAEKRIVFGIPRDDMVIIGTTDTDYTEDLEEVHTTSEDVEYLLGVANEYFPGANLTKKDIVASYAGVRPLVHDGSRSEGKTSREHIILSDSRNVTFVAGGKYTTYRLMSEQTVNAALDQFTPEDLALVGPSKTKVPLNKFISEESVRAAEAKVNDWASDFALSESLVRRLVTRHGAEAYEILLNYSARINDLRTDGERLWALEAHHALNNSMCLNLIDFYLRRTPLMLALKSHGLAYKELLLDVFSTELGWGGAERENQWRAVEHHIKHEMGWKLTNSH